jgi:hypothetical protein
MRQHARRSLAILTCFVLVATLGPVAPASAREKPRYGGELIFVGAAEPPSFDARREETFGMLHPGAPHYNTLLRVDPFDWRRIIPYLTKVRGWTVTPSHYLNNQLDTVWLSE